MAERWAKEQADHFWSNRLAATKWSDVNNDVYHVDVYNLVGQFDSMPEEDYLVTMSVWQDPDLTAFYLGKRLGMWPSNLNFRLDLKGVLYLGNPISKYLNEMLEQLTLGGTFEWDETKDQYRMVPGQAAPMAVIFDADFPDRLKKPYDRFVHRFRKDLKDAKR